MNITTYALRLFGLGLGRHGALARAVARAVGVRAVLVLIKGKGPVRETARLANTTTLTTQSQKEGRE